MSTVVVTANLGHLKAYRMEQTPTRGRKLDLIDEMEFPEAHGHFLDKVTDMAGRFPVSAGAGPGVAMAHGEALTAENEIHRRLVQLVGQRITAILEAERPEGWHFAASPEVHQAILNELSPELRERVVRHAHADLTKVPTSEVLEHFTGPRLA